MIYKRPADSNKEFTDAVVAPGAPAPNPVSAAPTFGDALLLRGALFAFAGFAVWAGLAVWVLGIPVGAALGFVAFQLLAVILPGSALLRLFSLELSALEFAVYSYALGFALNVAAYFCVAPFGRTDLIKYLLIAIVVAAFAVHIFKRGVPLTAKPDGGEFRIALVFCALAGAATFVAFSCVNLNPALSGARQYFFDTANASAILASASRGFPFEFLEMAGTPYYYHPFFFAYSSAIKTTLGLGAFEVMTKLTLITVSPFLAACAALLATRFVKTKTGVTAALLFSIALPLFGVNAFYYNYEDVIGFIPGVAFGLLFIYTLLGDDDLSPKKLSASFVLTALMLVMALGCKGPTAVTFMFGAGVMLLCRLAGTRNFAIIPKGLILAAMFFGFYLLLYRTGAGDSMWVDPGFTAIATEYGKSITASVPGVFGILLSCIVYALTCCKAITIALAAGIVLLILDKTRTRECIFIVSCAVFGMVMVNLFVQWGGSQIYFIIATYVASAAVVCGLIEHICERILQKHPGAQTRSITAMVLVVVFTVFIWYGWRNVGGNYAGALSSAREHSRFSDSKVVTEEGYAELEEKGLRRNTVTPEEYEAYLWLRDNTDPNAVICDGRYLKNVGFFCGAMFSERAFYLEGPLYVTMGDSNDYTDEKVRRDGILMFFYADADETFLPLLAEEGIDYVIVSQYINPGFEISAQFGEEVFRNSGITIYRIGD